MKRLPDWRGRTVACLASGPSLTVEDCVRVRDAECVTVVTNSTFRMCPWADTLLAHDAQWWQTHITEVRRCFTGRLLSPSIHLLHRDVESLAANPRWRNFYNSGANAVSAAILLGASKVIMLGYDCALTGGQTHHHGDHPVGMRNCDTIAAWPAKFLRLSVYAEKHLIPVVNASRVSALECFPRVSLEDALR